MATKWVDLFLRKGVGGGGEGGRAVGIQRGKQFTSLKGIT